MKLTKEQNRKSVLNHTITQKNILEERLTTAIERNDDELVAILVEMIDMETMVIRKLVDFLKKDGSLTSIVKTKMPGGTKKFE